MDGSPSSAIAVSPLPESYSGASDKPSQISELYSPNASGRPLPTLPWQHLRNPDLQPVPHGLYGHCRYGLDLDNHFYENIQSLVGFMTSNTGNLLSGEADRAVPGLVSILAVVHSLTPGYQPEAIFQFAPGPGSVVVGITIVDRPIIAAHT
jgi:hypothetical protein